mmetsp:Transcript_26578/g.67559  ORF Transcript_26578/g.67559 Transcript_26578/m.67559 type:complete len:99 (+) Transcript_26578:614-910(+)
MHDCQALISEVDGNSDGKISFEEFSRVVVSKSAVSGVTKGIANTDNLASIGSTSAKPGKALKGRNSTRKRSGKASPTRSGRASPISYTKGSSVARLWS